MPLVLDGTNGVSGVDGTASNPAIEGTDSNTGIFYPAADTVAIGTGGTEALRVNSSQQVGIGTTSILGNSVLNVAQGVVARNSGATLPYFQTYNSNAGTDLKTWRFGGNSSGALTFETVNDAYSSATGRMTLNASSQLSLNTTAANELLNIYANNYTYIGLYNSTTGTTSSDGGYIGMSNAELEIRNKENSIISLWTNNTERARITSGGYFKASNAGTYFNSTGNYHELRNDTSNSDVVVVTANNNSYAFSAHTVGVLRSASNAYSLQYLYSGNGTSPFADVEFNFRGDGNGYADGTFNNNGADYAEFFESVTGAALTLGATVVLDGNKVREATDQDPVSAIMGVVRPKEPSKASMVVGNTAWNKWANKYLTDDFDRYIMEDHDVVEWTDEDGKQHSYESHNIPAGVTVPDDAVIKTHDEKGNKFQHYKLNPAWNPDVEYVNRENRPEWIIVGLVGQVKILKGQPVNDRWIKMRDVSETVEEWMIR